MPQIWTGLLLIAALHLTGCARQPENEGNETQDFSGNVVVGSDGSVIVRAQNGVYVSENGQVTYTTAANGVIVGSDGSTIVRADNGVYVGSNGTTYVVVEDNRSPSSEPNTARPIGRADGACVFPARDAYVAPSGDTYFRLNNSDDFVGVDGSVYRMRTDTSCVDTNGDGLVDAASAWLKPTGNVWGVSDGDAPKCAQTQVRRCLQDRGGRACFIRWCQ
jgi:hypothetical protein